MEDHFESQQLRTRLIVAGIAELRQHGLADFSLRRVASACGASCAAPYKHFKNKDELILAILCYVNCQWELLEETIVAAHREDLCRLLIELCLANVRFAAANPDFGAILRMDERGLDTRGRSEIDRPMKKIAELTAALGHERGWDAETIAQKTFLLRALIYGTTRLLENDGADESIDALQTMRAVLERELA